MKLTLFRTYDDVALGHHPGFEHEGIYQKNASDNDIFENICQFYGIKVNYSKILSECDLIVFNLNRNHWYTNLNPVLLVDPGVWETVKQLNIPVVFWHSGECHSTLTEQWYTHAVHVIGKPIWYIDSNAKIQGDYHLFFDSSDIMLAQGVNLDLINIDNTNNTTTNTLYKFSTFTSRAEAHKNIICNHLNKNYKLSSYISYLDPKEFDQDLRLVDKFTDFDMSAPLPTKWIPAEQIRKIKECTDVLISLNTYFIKDYVHTWFNPTYITERFLLDLCLNKPTIPVGHPGTVQYYCDLGFEFPDWIDYSYDKIDNDNTRMKALIKLIDDLSKIKNLSSLSKNFQHNSTNLERFVNLSFKDSFFKIIEKIQNKMYK